MLALTLAFTWQLACGQTAPAAIEAQAPPPSAAAPAIHASAPTARASSARAATSRSSAASRQVTKPLWTELSPGQQQALAPLAAKWNTLSEAQKRKWLAMSQNYPRLAPAEQTKLQSRMTEWVALSPQQRTFARLNFGEAQQMTTDDKRAKWEAYKSLTTEEKAKLAASASKPPTTAAAIKPVQPEKLTTVPQTAQNTRTPRINVAPDQVQLHTLLPQQAPAPDAARTN